MRKYQELTNPNSCMSKAKYEEMTFVLLDRDIAAPATIRFWINERIKFGLNQPGDPKLIEAEECARIMEEEQQFRRVSVEFLLQAKKETQTAQEEGV